MSGESELKKLSDGRSIEILPLKGKHLMQAQQMTQGKPSGLMLALCAMGVKIEGKRMLYEELLEEDAFIAMEIMSAVMGERTENFMSAIPDQSSTTGM